MLAMLVEALRNAGLQEFQVSVGQIEYFKGLCANAALDEETELALREFISNRNEFGAQELLLEKNIPADSVKALLSVNSLFGTYDILDKALACADNQRSRNAIMHLKQVYELLKVYGVAIMAWTSTYRLTWLWSASTIITQASFSAPTHIRREAPSQRAADMTTCLKNLGSLHRRQDLSL